MSENKLSVGRPLVQKTTKSDSVYTTKTDNVIEQTAKNKAYINSLADILLSCLHNPYEEWPNHCLNVLLSKDYSEWTQHAFDCALRFMIKKLDDSPQYGIDTKQYLYKLNQDIASRHTEVKQNLAFTSAQPSYAAITSRENAAPLYGANVDEMYFNAIDSGFFDRISKREDDIENSVKQIKQIAAEYIAKYPRSENPYRLLAALYGKMGEPANRASVLDQGVRYAKNSVHCRFLLAQVQLDEGSYIEALANLKYLVAQKDLLKQEHIDLSRVYIMLALSKLGKLKNRGFEPSVEDAEDILKDLNEALKAGNCDKYKAVILKYAKQLLKKTGIELTPVYAELQKLLESEQDIF